MAVGCPGTNKIVPAGKVLVTRQFPCASCSSVVWYARARLASVSPNCTVIGAHPFGCWHSETCVTVAPSKVGERVGMRVEDGEEVRLIVKANVGVEVTIKIGDSDKVGSKTGEEVAVGESARARVGPSAMARDMLPMTMVNDNRAAMTPSKTWRISFINLPVGSSNRQFGSHDG